MTFVNTGRVSADATITGGIVSPAQVLYYSQASSSSVVGTADVLTAAAGKITYITGINYSIYEAASAQYIRFLLDSNLLIYNVVASGKTDKQYSYSGGNPILNAGEKIQIYYPSNLLSPEYLHITITYIEVTL